MTDTTTAPQTSVVDEYFAMWNEEDADARRQRIAAAWAADGAYVDPLLEANGQDALHAMVDGVQAQYPGYRFRRTTAVDVHHDRARFGWELFGPDGDILVAGIDVATFAPDGRLASITGFFGPLDEEAA